MLNKTNYKHIIAFILAGACPACTDKLLLAEASWLPQAISLIPDCPNTIRKMVLRSIWLLLAGNPLFLQQMEEEGDSHSMLQGFFITKGDKCASFNLQLSLGLGSLYLWAIAAPITALQMSFSPSAGPVRSGALQERYQVEPHPWWEEGRNNFVSCSSIPEKHPLFPCWHDRVLQLGSYPEHVFYSSARY